MTARRVLLPFDRYSTSDSSVVPHFSLILVGIDD